MKKLLTTAAGAIALTFATALPQTANAEGFSVEDLGNVVNDQACISRARRSFEYYKGEVRAGNIGTGTWTAALYNIYTNDYDALVVCNYGPNGQTRATLIVYADDHTDSELRRSIASRLKQIWKQVY